MSRTIKFTHDYPKLWGQKQGRLILVKIIKKKELKENLALIEYDTYWCDGGFKHKWNLFDESKISGYFSFPDSEHFIQLVFLGDKGIPFCTLRSFNEEKYKFYGSEIGNIFRMEITNEG
jgi:hypothetical protein